MKSMKQGLQDASPIMLAYFPISITFGVLASNAGFPSVITCLISLCVYAGSAQFMMVSLAVTSMSPVSLIITILLVNLRHVLYGTTLGPAFVTWPESKKLINAFGLTDEVYAVTMSRGITLAPRPRYQFTFTFACYASWVAGTIVGTQIGNIVPASVSTVLSYALPALFMALLLIGNRTLPYLIAAVVGAGIAVLADLAQLGSIGMMAGAVVGATVGLFVGRAMADRRGVPDVAAIQLDETE